MAGTAVPQGVLQPGQADFASEMRAKAQAKRKAAAPGAMPVSTVLGPNNVLCVGQGLGFRVLGGPVSCSGCYSPSQEEN